MGDLTAEMDMLRLAARAYHALGDWPKAVRLADEEQELRETLRQRITSPTMRAGFSNDHYGGAQDQIDRLMELWESSKDESFSRRALEVADQYRAAFFIERPSRLASIQEVQALLDENTALIEFWFGREQCFAWAVTSSGFAAAKLLPMEVMETAARNVYESLSARSQRVAGENPVERSARIAKAEERYRSAAAELSGLLFGRLPAAIQKSRLLIVSDMLLSYVPLGALPDPRGQPLLVNHEIVNVPSAAAVLAMAGIRAGAARPAKRLAILADPVFDSSDARLTGPDKRPVMAAPLNRGLMEASRAAGVLSPANSIPRLAFAGREAQAAMRLVPPGEVLYLGSFDATREAVFDPQLRAYQVLHFATHGFINDNPDLSGLVLSLTDRRGNARDGFLRLRDVYGLRLSSELVVLSACQTALGRVFQGAPVIGLSSGFLRAGAARVIATLWKVDDEASAEIMSRFYGHLWGPAGLSPAAALRAAQLSVASEKEWRSPYYWAGYAIYGDWR
jgi:CHAT domain-containing protein